jgi:transposase
MKERKFENMAVINPFAAGVDVGSKSHYVAVGQDPQEDVREFGVYSRDHEMMISYLKSHGITSVAMESTGSYWQSLFLALQKAGFEVLLVSGHQTKNVRAKTDVKDCIWIQKLHSLGLLRGCFLPDKESARLRTLQRHRSSLIEESAKMVNKIQKAMRMMNLRLDVVISDITGKTGTAIIEAIIDGERDGKALSLHTDPRIKKSREEVALALQGNWDEELLYEMTECYHIYNFLQDKIKSCEKRLEDLLDEFTREIYIEESLILSSKQLKGKNQPKFDLPMLSYKFYGVDLFAVESISSSTVLTLICEIGHGIYNFKSAKHFASFLRLAPNNKVSGGKIISSRTPKGSNKLALALRNAANTIDRTKDGALTRFFKRVAYKKGRGAAITATARKLAAIIWNMIVKKEAYQPQNLELYQQQMKAKMLASIKKKILSLNLSVDELNAALKIS